MGRRKNYAKMVLSIIFLLLLTAGCGQQQFSEKSLINEASDTISDSASIIKMLEKKDAGEVVLPENVTEKDIEEYIVVTEQLEDCEAAKTEVMQEMVPDKEVHIPERIEASYEQWLAASMVVAISMYYTDFEITGIYLTGENAVENKNLSQGVFLSFVSNGSEVTVCSMPLEDERTVEGTLDIGTADLGLATFDVVEGVADSVGDYRKVEVEDLGDLISQSLLVTIYEH